MKAPGALFATSGLVHCYPKSRATFLQGPDVEHPAPRKIWPPPPQLWRRPVMPTRVHSWSVRFDWRVGHPDGVDVADNHALQVRGVIAKPSFARIAENWQAGFVTAS